MTKFTCMLIVNNIAISMNGKASGSVVEGLVRPLLALEGVAARARRRLVA